MEGFNFIGETDGETIQILKALGHGERVKLLFLLKTGKKTLGELNRVLDTRGSHLFASLNTLASVQLVRRVKVDIPTWEITELGIKAIEIYQHAKRRLKTIT